MKLSMLCLMLFMSAAPVLARQQTDEAASRETGVFGIYALGNLAVQDYQKGNEPVQQLKEFFVEAKQPLSSLQQDQLNSIVEAQVKAIQAGSQSEDAVRLNLEYNKKISDTLTADQRMTLRRYRTEQIMMRFGFPALKTILENAQAPLTADQEAKAQALYRDFYQQANQLTSNSKAAPDRAQLYKLASQSLGQVVHLLTADQRRALVASRQGTLSAKVRP